MIIQVRDWYGERSLREQRLMLAMASIALPLLLWLALIVPINRAYDRALERQLEAVDRNARILSLADRAKGSRARAPVPVPDLGLFLADNARQRGLTALPSAAPQPGASIVTVAAASGPDALEWLRALEGQGYTVADVRITPAPDGTVAVTATIGGGR